MGKVKTYTAEQEIKPGYAVVLGSTENQANLPGEKGAGVFLGFYDASYSFTNPVKTGKALPVTLYGVVMVLTGNAVTAGKEGVLVDSSGKVIELKADTPSGIYQKACLFLKSSTGAGEFVEALIVRGTIEHTAS